MTVPSAHWNPVLVPRLSALRVDGRLRLELLVPDDVAEPLHAEFDHLVDARAFELAVGPATRLLRGSESPSPAGEAQTAGGLLYRTLVPEPLREPLMRLAGGPLLVRTNVPSIPWEMLHDGGDFWGFSFALGKQTVVRAIPASDAPGVAFAQPTRVLLIGSDPAGDLPFVTAETEQLYRALAPVADVRCLNGPLATFTSVTASLAARFDIVHYCGHIVSSPGGPALVLADSQPLSAETLTRHLVGRPVVFLNGCTSGAAPAASADDASPLASLADHVLRARATAVVGTLRDVRDAHAAQIASVFYRLLLEHSPIGEALRRARLACRDAGGAGTPSGPLAFTLFGNPAHVPMPVPDRASAARPAPQPTPAATRRLPERPKPADIGRRAAIVAAVAIGVAGVLLGRRALRPLPRPEGPPSRPPSDDIVVWVQPFRNAAEGDRRDEFGSKLSNSIAARLRNLHAMKMYSAADTAELERDGAGEVEIVKHLDATKTVAGTYRIDGARVHADVRVVDVGTGHAELRFPADGSMQNVDAVALDIAEQVAHTLRILRLMLDGEGERGGGAAGEPGASLHRRLAWLAPASAFAADVPADVLAFLEQYRGATERGDLDALSTLYATFPAEQRASQQSYFESVRDLRVQLQIHEVDAVGDEASVSYTRTDDCTDAHTGRPMHLAVNLKKTLRRIDGVWKFQPVDRGPQ